MHLLKQIMHLKRQNNLYSTVTSYSNFRFTYVHYILKSSKPLGKVLNVASASY